MTRASLVALAALGPVALSALGACSAAPHSRAAGAVATLAVRPVAWNAANAPMGNVRAVGDSGDVVCVFADDGVSILSARAVVARDTHVKGWTYGDSIDATDGSARWIVGIDGSGHVYRLRALNAFEDVSARYGLASKHVHSATMVGKGKVGFLLDKEIALSDASRMAVYPTTSWSAFSGGGGFGAGVSKDAIDVVNGTNAIVTHYPLEDAMWAVLDSKGRLYAATKRGVYAADSTGTLALVFDAGHDGIHGLVASGDRVWFADRGELGIIDGDHVAETSGSNIAADAKLQASPSGDVWVIGGGKLDRFESLSAPANVAGASGTPSSHAPPGGAAPPSTSSWSSLIAPVFARSCAACHQPDGISGTDLSNEAAWTTKRPLIKQRVLVAHTMPPQGHALSDADREAIHAWIEGTPATPQPQH